MLAIIVAHTFVGFVCVAGGHPGAKWHIGFPMWMKQNWGIWGYLFPMVQRVCFLDFTAHQLTTIKVIRVFLSFVWTATNTWYGGQCLKVLLTCIWPSFLNLDTELACGTMEVSDFVAFVVYVLLCLPLMWFKPESYKKPFVVASVTVATTVFALLIWSLKRTGGGGRSPRRRQRGDLSCAGPWRRPRMGLRGGCHGQHRQHRAPHVVAVRLHAVRAEAGRPGARAAGHGSTRHHHRGVHRHRVHVLRRDAVPAGGDGDAPLAAVRVPGCGAPARRGHGSAGPA